MAVVTEASGYLVNLEEKWVLRTPGGNHDNWVYPVAELRRDGERIELVQVIGEIKVGAPMVMLLRIRDDGVYTARRTTPVIAVVELEDV
jgi:hypothetical protein